MCDEFPDANNHMFTILTLNIASIATNLQKFQDQVLSISNIKYDVIGFSETRLDDDIEP